MKTRDVLPRKKKPSKKKKIHPIIIGSIIAGVFAIVAAFVGRPVTNIDNSINTFGASVPQRDYDNFSKTKINALLEEYKESARAILIFFESGKEEAGEYACSINAALSTEGFTSGVLPDSNSGFGGVSCVQHLREHDTNPPMFNLIERLRKEGRIIENEGGIIVYGDKDGENALVTESFGKSIVLWIGEER